MRTIHFFFFFAEIKERFVFYQEIISSNVFRCKAEGNMFDILLHNLCVLAMKDSFFRISSTNLLRWILNTNINNRRLFFRIVPLWREQQLWLKHRNNNKCEYFPPVPIVSKIIFVFIYFSFPFPVRDPPWK